MPKNASLLTLPPYSPELNPVKNFWQFLRQNHPSNRVYKTYEAPIMQRGQRPLPQIQRKCF